MSQTDSLTHPKPSITRRNTGCRAFAALVKE